MDKIQVIKKKCCGAVFAGCCEPECYTDSDWLKDLKKYVKEGCTVETVEKGHFSWGKCECVQEKDKNKIELFQKNI